MVSCVLCPACSWAFLLGNNIAAHHIEVVPLHPCKPVCPLHCCPALHHVAVGRYLAGCVWTGILWIGYTQTHQTGQAIGEIQSGKTSPTTVGVSITYGEQKNRQTSNSYHTESQASQLLSGAGPVVLMATGQGKDSQINITGSDVIGKGGTHLYADGGINIQAAKNTHSEHSRNSNKGWNAGVSLNFGSGISLGNYRRRQ